jgi:hypothetical protein
MDNAENHWNTPAESQKEYESYCEYRRREQLDKKIERCTERLGMYISNPISGNEYLRNLYLRESMDSFKEYCKEVDQDVYQST